MTDLKTVDVDRRRFLNRTLIGALSVFGLAFGGGSIAILWPTRRPTGFGTKIDAGSLKEIFHRLDKLEEPLVYNLEGQFYLIRYDGDLADTYDEQGFRAAGMIALYQKCPHLGCRTPFCPTSQQFECPCHASYFNRAGERLPGSPAPAGMWRFPIEIVDGRVIVDTAEPLAQPKRGTDSLRQEPAGPRCA
jgi:cytochrome b6-f complex iron-sulfur subunit